MLLFALGLIIGAVFGYGIACLMFVVYHEDGEEQPMKCPYCGGESIVTDSRLRKAGFKWRNRRCKVCGHYFSTRETYAKDYSQPRAFIRRR